MTRSVASLTGFALMVQYQCTQPPHGGSSPNFVIMARRSQTFDRNTSTFGCQMCQPQRPVGSFVMERPYFPAISRNLAMSQDVLAESTP